MSPHGKKRDEVLRRQGQPVNLTVPTPDDDGRPPECFGHQRPVLPPEVAEPDPAVCGREIAFLRAKVAQHRDEPFPVKVLFTTKMLMALLYLRGPNRPPGKIWIGRYIKMSDRPGGWKKTHQHLAFDTDGLLRDGLHRVLAFIQSGVERYGWIWFGCDPESFAVMDTGNRRSAAQNLGIYGDDHPTLTAAVIRLRFRNEHGGEMPDDLLVHETGVELTGNPLFNEAVACSHLLFKETGTNKSSAVLAYWLIGENSERKSLLGIFWTHLVKGTVGKGVDEEVSPLRACRNKLIRMAKDEKFRHAQYLSQTQVTAWIIEAWNLWTHDLPAPSQKWPLWNRPHALPPVDADDSYGSGEGKRVVQNRMRNPAPGLGRRRTPGNVVRALGIPR